MSRWQLPAQKGTELWPSSTRAPTKIVFEGLPPGSPLARALFEELRGEIDRFHAKAAQSYALGVTDQGMMHQSTDAMAIRYQNNQGQETLTVKPSKELVRRVQKKPTGDVWDWALIEIVMPYAGDDARMTGLAEMVVPVLETITPSATLPWVGVTRGGITSGSTSPDERVLFSPSTTFEQSRAVDEQRASFLVDLRPMRGVPIVAVDLRAHIDASAELRPTAFVAFASTPGTLGGGLAPPGEMGDTTDPVRTLSDPWPPETFSSMTNYTGQPGVPFPPIVFNETTKYWDFGGATVEVATYPGGPLITAFTVDTFVPGFFFPWYVFAVASRPSDWRPPGPDTAPVEIRGRVFKGAPELVSSREITSGGVLTYRWAAAEGETPELPTLADAVATTDEFGGLFERFGYTLAGRVHIDTRTGGISFNAA